MDVAKMTSTNETLQENIFQWFCDYHKIYVKEALKCNNLAESKRKKVAKDTLFALIARVKKNYCDAKNKSDNEYNKKVDSILSVAKRRKTEMEQKETEQ